MKNTNNNEIYINYPPFVNLKPQIIKPQIIKPQIIKPQIIKPKTNILNNLLLIKNKNK
jgi:hypothetical protein